MSMKLVPRDSWYEAGTMVSVLKQLSVDPEVTGTKPGSDVCLVSRVSLNISTEALVACVKIISSSSSS